MAEKKCGTCRFATVPFDDEEVICCNKKTPGEQSIRAKDSCCGRYRKMLEPEICPICKKKHEIKWIAGMDKKTAAITNHPFGGLKCWYMEWCGGVIFENPKYDTVDCQRKTKEKLIRRWNRAVLEAIKEELNQVLEAVKEENKV